MKRLLFFAIISASAVMIAGCSSPPSAGSNPLALQITIPDPVTYIDISVYNPSDAADHYEESLHYKSGCPATVDCVVYVGDGPYTVEVYAANDFGWCRNAGRATGVVPDGDPVSVNLQPLTYTPTTFPAPPVTVTEGNELAWAAEMTSPVNMALDHIGSVRANFYESVSSEPDAFDISGVIDDDFVTGVSRTVQFSGHVDAVTEPRAFDCNYIYIQYQQPHLFNTYGNVYYMEYHPEETIHTVTVNPR